MPWVQRPYPTIFRVLALVLVVSGCRDYSGRIQTAVDRHHRALARLPGEDWVRVEPPAADAPTGPTPESLPPGVLDLATARELAVHGNPDVHAARARLEAAVAQVTEARARYYPTVVITHTSTRTFHTPANRNRLATLLQPTQLLPSDLDPSGFTLTTLLNAIRRPLFGGANAGGISRSFSEHSTALSVSWVVFDGFVREAQTLAAQALHKASQASLEDVKRILIELVDTAYHQVQLAEEQIRIAQADESFSQEQLRETEKLKEAGRATSADVDNFRVRMLTARANVTAARGLRETGRVVLAELMGFMEVNLPESLELSPLVDETEAEMTLPEAEVWLKRALLDRPDLRQLEHLLTSKEEQIHAAEGVYLPTLAVSSSWGFDRSSNMRYSDDDQSSALAMEFRWELYSGGMRRAQVRQAVSTRMEAAANVRRRRLAVQSEVRRAIIDLQNAQEQIRLQRENVNTARENRRIVRAGYHAGKETLNRLNEAQRDFITAEADLALARIRLRESWSDLHAAAGTFGEAPAESPVAVE